MLKIEILRLQKKTIHTAESSMMHMAPTSFYLLLVAFFIPLTSFGQTMTGKDITDHMLIDLSKKVDRSVANYDGSPYLSEEFVSGEVYGTKKKFTGLLLRYNIFNDNIEFMQKGATYALYAEPRIVKVLLGNETYVVETYEIKGKMAPGYFARLDSGKVTLLVKKIVRFTEEQEPKALQGAATPAKFTRVADVFYYRIGNAQTSKVGSLKSFIDSLPEKKEDVSAYAKKEKLGTKNESDLVKLVKYYNSLP
jgi:hypothetical protein